MRFPQKLPRELTDFARYVREETRITPLIPSLLTCMKHGALIILVAACSPAQSPPPSQPQGHVVTEVGFVAMQPPGASRAPGDDGLDGDATLVIPPAKDQPPHVKLKLGHYINYKRGIGVTIDLISARTENVADIDPAKLRFDGDATVYVLEGNQARRDRTDFARRDGGVMLHAWDNGRRAVYVPDPEGGPASEMIEVVRDSDADPL